MPSPTILRRWSHHTGGTVVPSGWRATLLALGIGADVIYSCSCGTQFAVDVDGHGAAAAPCPRCGNAVPLVELPEEPATCCSCLQRGRAALTKDTEYGMVRWEDAVLGRTHGRPGLRDVVRGFALLRATDGGWVPVQAPAEVLLELVRTPTYARGRASSGCSVVPKR